MVIGLTGGIGSGKSTVAAMFAARGAHVIDTDVVAREVVAPPSPVLDAITYEFGAEFIRADGTLDREALARVVFSDPRKRSRLNQLTHPAIAARTLELIASAPQSAPVVVVVPLLFESAFDKHCDTVVAVVADQALRRSRIVARDRSTEADVAARMNAQLSDDEHSSRANHVVRNDGDLAHLECQVEEIWKKLGHA